MLKEMLFSKFETYLLDEQDQQESVEHHQEEQQQKQIEYPPGFFSAL